MALEIEIWPLRPVVFDGDGAPFWGPDGRPLSFAEFPALDLSDGGDAPPAGRGQLRLAFLLLILAGGLYAARRFL